MTFPDIEPALGREERKLRLERLQNIERRRQRLEDEKPSLIDRVKSDVTTGAGSAFTTLGTVGNIMGEAAVTFGELQAPDPSPSMRAHSKLTVEELQNMWQGVQTPGQTALNIADLHEQRGGFDKLLGVIGEVGFGAAGAAGRAGTHLLREFGEEVTEDVVSPVIRTFDETGDVIPQGTTSKMLPDDVLPVSSITPSALMDNVIGLPAIRAGLTRLEQIENVIRHMGDPLGIGGIQNNPLANRALDIRNQVKAAITNTSSVLGLKHSASLRAAFDIGKSGRVLDDALVGIDPAIPGSPSLSDIAARLPRYWEFLTPTQQKAMISLRDALQPYRDLMNEVGMLEDIGTRTDIIKFSDISSGFHHSKTSAMSLKGSDVVHGLTDSPYLDSLMRAGGDPPDGFYIPRGNALKEGDDFAKGPQRNRFGFQRSGLGGADKTAVFDSVAEGIESGWTYSDIGPVLTSHARNVSNKATDTHIGTYFKEAVDPITEELLGETPKVLMMRKYPGLRAEWDFLRNETERLQSLVTGIDDRVRNVLDEFLGIGELADIDKFAAAIGDINVVKGGLNEGATRVEVMDIIAGIKERVKDIRPEWDKAKTIVDQRFQPGQRGIINFPGLEKRAFPDHVADKANKILEGAPTWIRGVNAAINPFNNMYRAFRATGEFSAIYIQGLLGLADSPTAHNDALKLMFRSLGDPEVLGKKLVDFDNKAVKNGRVEASVWARAKLRQGGADTEYSFGEGFMSAVGDLPAFKQVNRAYGFFGDTLRLEWADELLRQQMAGSLGITGQRLPRTLDEIIKSGDLEKIATIVNNMTGYSEMRTAGSVGDLLLFAPRFLQSRLNVLAKTVADGGVEGEAARRAMIRMIGLTTSQIVALNHALGNETDFRPVIDGKPNSNFMVVRALGQDWKFFGTWDSMVRATVLTAGGNGREAFRAMGSGLVQNTWNYVSGRTAMGEDVPEFPGQDEFNPGEFAKFMLQENIAPFASEDAGQAVQKIYSGIRDENLMQVAEGAAGIVGAGTGLKSSQLSPSELRDEARSEVMTNRGLEGDFYDLDGDVRRDIDQEPSVQETTSAVLEKRRERGSGYQAYLDKKTDLEANYKQGVTALWTLFARSRGDALNEGEDPVFGKQFRERLSELSRDLSRDKDKLREDSSEDLEFLEEFDPSTNEYDIAFETYLKAVSDPTLEDPVSGMYNFEERERRIQAMKDDPDIGPLTVARIERDLQRNQHPIVANLRRDQVTMAPYFELTMETLIALETEHPSEFGGLTDLYEQYMNIEESLKPFDILKDEYKPLRIAFDLMEGQKTEWLRSQPTGEIDRLLVKWGYRNTGTHEDVRQEIADKWVQKQQ